MNSFLASALSLLNALVAVALIAGGGFAAVSYLPHAQRDDTAFYLLGAVAGFLAAVLVCGILAVFLDMRASLRRIIPLLENLDKAS